MLIAIDECMLHHASLQSLGPDLGPVLGQTWVRPNMPIGSCTSTAGGPALCA